MAAERVYEEAGHDLTVTTCFDSKHSTGSLHYAGAAIGLRTRDVPRADPPKLVERIEECLQSDFDVIIENVEFQPKQA